MTVTEATPITGKALLGKINKEFKNLSRREKAKACGYYTTTKDGQTRVNIGEFLNAVIEAQGIALTPEGAKDGRGREPTYRVSVHKNGQIVIGSTYTQEMGLKEGEQFEIKLGYKHIHLIQLSDDEDEEE